MLLLLTGCSQKSPKESGANENIENTTAQEEIDSIKHTVEFLNSLEWTEDEIAHLDTIRVTCIVGMQKES